MPRMLILTCLVAVAMAAVGAVASSGATRTTPCQNAEPRVHDEVVFGHFSTRTQASKMSRRAAKLGFQGINIEDKGCGNYQVAIGGADDTADRVSFAREAKRAGFEVTFEQTGPPMQPPAGQVVGVFAKFATVSAANKLATRLASIDFRYIDLVRIGTSWAVVMPQVPVANAPSIVQEVQKAGYKIAFRHA